MDPALRDARLRHYRLERLLGAGGMGSVYLARDLSLDRPVAIKFIAPDKSADEGARRRLLREARAAAALDHPNICTVHEVIDDPAGPAYIVMQYVEGETLAGLLNRGPLDPRLALSLATDLASALSAAHKRGVVHRDLKPHNVIVTPGGHAKLLDFGIARYRDAVEASGNATTGTHLTGADSVPGTPAYMSPEQVLGSAIDERSDLFSLGVVLFECLTGQRAFKGHTSFELASEIVGHDPPPVSSLRPELTGAHDELCRRLLAKDRGDRFQSADELLGALRVLQPDTARSSHPSQPAAAPPTARREVRSWRWVGAAALLAIAAWVAWRSAAPAPADVATLGVLPFRNESGDPSNDALAAGLTEAIASRLAAVQSLQILPLDEVREALLEQPDRERISAVDPRPARAGAVAQALGANVLVAGSVVAGRSGPEVVTAIVRADGSRLASGRHPASGSVFDLHDRTAAELLEALAKQGLTVSGSAAATAPPTASMDAFAEYSQARVFLERPDVPGNLDHAISLFQSAIAKDPGFALAYSGLADAYWAQFQETQDPAWTTRAMAANLDALRIDPDRAETRMSLALAYNAQGSYQTAVEELQRVLTLQPRHDGAHRLLAEIHAARAEWDAAIAEAQWAVNLRPGYWRSHHQLGLSYFRAGRYNEAARAFSRVVELQPDSARGHQTLGTALQAAGRNDEALEQYQQALAIRPSGRTYSNVGTLHFWRGDYANAAAAYEQAVELLPNDPALQANLGDAHAQLGQPEQATSAYRLAVEKVQRLLAVSPNDPQRLADLGLYRAKLGERDAALASVTRATAINRRDGQVLYVSALVHALAGRSEAACNALAAAIENGASTEEARQAHELKPLTGCAAYQRIIRNGR